MKKLYLFTWIFYLFLFPCKLTAQISTDTPVIWGYCNDEIASAVGANSQAQLSGAIYVPAEAATLYQGDIINDIHIGLANEVTNLTVFIASDLNNNTQAVKKEVGEAPAGWNTIKLDNPYTITNEGFYVGYTCIGIQQLGVSDLFSENGNWININGEWSNYASSQQWNALCIRMQIEGKSMPNDVALLKVEPCYSKAGEPFTLSGIVKSTTTLPITNYEVTCKIGNGKEFSQTIEADINANETDTFRIEVAAVNEAGEYPLHISITKVNNTNDAYAENSSLVTTLSNKEYVFKRKIVVEEGTGIWCIWCPRGIVSLREMKKKYPDSFIGIAIHYQDPMADKSYADFISSYLGTNFPICILNRKKEKYKMDPSFRNIEEAYLNELNLAEAGITATSNYTSEQETSVEINTQTVFGHSEEKAAYRIAFVVLENGVTGYLQQNGFAGGVVGEMGGFEKEGPSVNMPFDDVARGIFKSYTGTMRSVPSTLVKGETYTYSYELTLPNTIQNKENIEIAVLLINSKSGEIINADKTKVKKNSSNIKQASTQTEFRIYSENGTIKIDMEHDSLQIFTTEGTPVPNKNLQPGIYLVRVTKGNAIYVRKAII